MRIRAVCRHGGHGRQPTRYQLFPFRVRKSEFRVDVRKGDARRDHTDRGAQEDARSVSSGSRLLVLHPVELVRHPLREKHARPEAAPGRGHREVADGLQHRLELLRLCQCTARSMRTNTRD